MKHLSFTRFANEVIEELHMQGRYATAHIFKYALRAVAKSIGGGEIFFGGINKCLLAKFLHFLEKNQRSYNTISTYIRALRTIYNRAVDKGLIRGEFRLFAGLKTGVASERKLAITALQMNSLLSTLPAQKSTQKLCQAQDCMKLMIMLQGMPFTDLVHLQKKDIKDDRIVCRRRKTGTELSVKLLPETMELINRYRNNDSSSPYLLNILKNSARGKEAYDEYNSKLRTLNIQLAKLAKICGIKKIRVSSYTARHTWATLAKHCKVSEEVISEALGHSSLNVTRTYMKSFEGDELANANKIIIDYILTGKKTLWK